MRALLAPAILLALLAAPRQGEDAPAFPVAELLPRAETGADRFLAENPEYDGRGVVVAIFDTGVDPGAPGLQVTSDGRPKIIDLVDGSGSGDVDTKTVRRAGADGTFPGLSGRTLRPDPAWTNPSGEWRIGLKPAWEIFPAALVTRMKKERDEKFQVAQRDALADARRALEAWDAANPEPDAAAREARKDLAARAEQLEAMAKHRDDPGPVYDCIVFNDGTKWRAAVDTDEDGDFSDEKALAKFRDEHEWATFGEPSLLNFALNVYENGDRLSIVADAGAHGTHVAGIVAANYPDEPEHDGLAPGAQLVAVKIGDTRLGSSSVGTGDVRGYVAALANGADLVNMSYGGADRVVNTGRLNELRSEFVDERGVIFVSSAGNDGPGISSLGGPGGTSSATYGIGAIVSPAMMEAQYAIRKPYPELPYQWSSRGPAVDGWLGVDFCAPGGAISPVPNWELKGSTLMNGTSMSSPSVAGGVALLLSGMKDRGLAWSPHSVRRAIAATARPMAGASPWAEGAGVMRIDEAWKLLAEDAGRDDRDARYELTVPSRDDARGLYLREPFENDRPLNVQVKVDPIFPRDAPRAPMVKFEKRLRLKSTADWIDVGDVLLVAHGGRTFEVRVDPRGLPPGIHFGEVIGTDSEDPAAGPLFRFPVTVVRTRRVTAETDWTYRETADLSSGGIARTFLAAPDGATWVDIRVRRLDTGADRTLILHAIQLIPDQAFSDHDVRAYLDFREGEEATRSLGVVGGRTLEVALAQSWASLGASKAEVEVRFHGIRPSEDRLALTTDDPAPVDVHTVFRAETLDPEGELTVLRRTLLPESTAVSVLDAERDSLWDGRIDSQVVARYRLDAAAGEWNFRPVFALLPNAEEEFESMLWTVFDENGRVLGVHSGADGSPVELPKGEVTILLHVRHEDPELLQRVVAQGLRAELTLKKPVKVPVRPGPGDALLGGAAFGRRDLRPVESVRLWLVPPGPDDLPDEAKPGDVLVGSLRLGAESGKRGGAGHRPEGWPLEVSVAPKPEAGKGAEKKGGEEAQTPTERLNAIAESVRDLQVEKLKSLSGPENDEAFDKLAREILAKWPGNLQVLVAQLERVDGKDGIGPLREVTAAADRVIDAVDRRALAEYFGTETDQDDPAARKEHEAKVAERAALREALFRKARVLLAAAAAAPDDGSLRKRLDPAWDELEKWADPDDDDVLVLRADHERLLGRPGSALALLNERIAEPDAPRSVREKRVEVMEALGWDHWVENERREIAVRFPPETFLY